MIARLEERTDAELRRALVGVLVPADPELWSRRAAIAADLLTWWAVMEQLQAAIARPKNLGLSAPLAVRHFRRIGQVLEAAGATSGAELLDGRALVARRATHGAWRYER